ncbi:MAG: hypothetical protein IPN38_08425 [Flavobacteriales bacterium]|nr:hypothetical protein [Flavobacteriales bacterium]
MEAGVLIEPALGFGQWMLFGVPYAFLHHLGCSLTRVLFRPPGAVLSVERHA